MKEQNKAPKTLVESISRISDLDEQVKRLTDSVTKLSLEEQSKKQSVMQLSGELNKLSNELDKIQQDIDEKLGEYAGALDDIAERRKELENLNSAMAATNKRLGEDRVKIDIYVRNTVDSYVEELLNNRMEFLAGAFSTLLLTLKNNFMLQYEFMELIRKPLVNDDDIKKLTNKALNLLEPCYQSLRDNIAKRTYWNVRGQVR